jgi:hypothetical protein
LTISGHLLPGQVQREGKLDGGKARRGAFISQRPKGARFLNGAKMDIAATRGRQWWLAPPLARRLQARHSDDEILISPFRFLYIPKPFFIPSAIAHSSHLVLQLGSTHRKAGCPSLVSQFASRCAGPDIRILAVACPLSVLTTAPALLRPVFPLQARAGLTLFCAPNAVLIPIANRLTAVVLFPLQSRA